MKKHSLKFWIAFWLVSIVLLIGWFFYLELKNHNVKSAVTAALTFLPMDASQKEEYKTLATLGDALLFTNGQTKTYLVLFQNNMELRPGGGFIGAFAIVKIKDGKIVSMDTHDLSNFDGRIPNTIAPPYPMTETLHIDAWKMRDSNFSPDFATNAKKAMEFYYMGEGQEQFDGVIGITANMLTSMLKVTGPIQIEGYPGTYDSENAIISLEYQVEKAFEQQGINRGERKDVIKALGQEIEKRIFNLSTTQKMELAKILLEDLNHKDIQLYFKDAALEKSAAQANWAGSFNQNWNKDFLMTVDANLGAFKSDYYVKRATDYTLDFSGDKPKVILKIVYNHTAKQKDWMTRDYTSYLRVYVPDGAWFENGSNFDNVQFGNEFGKKYFGAIIKVPIDSSKTIELNYFLPQNITAENYSLLIQKQAGLKDIPVAVHIINKDGSRKDFQYTMNSDIIVKK
jgi:hypothetical protein